MGEHVYTPVTVKIAHAFLPNTLDTAHLVSLLSLLQSQQSVDIILATPYHSPTNHFKSHDLIWFICKKENRNLVNRNRLIRDDG